MRTSQKVLAFLICLASFFAQAASGVTPPGVDAPSRRQLPPYPPPDPAIYKHNAVVKLNYGGTGKDSFWLFEPDDPKPEQAPLIVFIPGWTATNPINLGVWFDHLVKQGNIVAYLQYQDSAVSPPFSEAPYYALDNFRQALAELQEGSRPDGSPHVQPDLNRFSAFGHSAGGMLTVNMVALAKEAGLPQPKVIFAAIPGRDYLLWRAERVPLFPLLDLSALPGDALLVAVTADQDNFFGARTKDSVRLLTEATVIPPENRYLYFTQTIRSLQYGRQPANHRYPSASDPAYDSGEPAGLNLFPDRPVLSAVLDAFMRPGVDRLVVLNNLDYEVWRLFDEVRAVRFDDAQWTMPVIPFTDIHLPSR